MANKKSKTKVIALSALVASTSVVGIYANRESVKNNSEENVETAKLLVDKIDKDTVKVSIENVNHASKAFQLSLKIDGNVQFIDNQESVKWLTSVETNKNSNIESIIQNDYILSEDKKSIDIFVTSDDELDRKGSIIEVCEIDLNKTNLKSSSDYKIIPSDVKPYKSVDINNKSITVANMDYDIDNILKFNNAPKIELKSDVESESGYPKIDIKNNIITIKEGYEFKAKDFILVKDDEDGNIPVDNVEVKDSNGSIMPDSAKNLKIGTYEIIYRVVDSESETTSLNTTLIVEPNVWKDIPTIVGVPQGPIKLNVGEVFDVYAPSGEPVTATDAVGNNIEVIVSGDLDLNTIGTYTITYTAKDRFDNIKTQELVIQVGSDEDQPKEDTDAPVFDYKGKTDITLANGMKFEIPLVTASDNVDTGIIVNTSILGPGGTNVDNIDTNIPGEYKITYIAKDKSNNKAELVIKVTVKESISGVEVGSGNATSEKNALEVKVLTQVTSLNNLLDEIKNDKYEAKVYGDTVIDKAKNEATYVIKLYKKQNFFAKLFNLNKNEEVYYLKLTVKNTDEFKNILNELPKEEIEKPPTGGGGITPSIPHTTVEELIGSDRYETAAKISKEGYNSANTVILVNGHDKHLVDGLTATPLASVKNAPILLSDNNKLSIYTINEIKRLNPSKVIVIGGEVVMPQSVIDEVKKINSKISVQRIGGQTRYETSLNIAKEIDKTNNITKVYVGAGDGEADSLSISSVAGREKAPIILTAKDGLDKDTYEYIKSQNILDGYIIGGSEKISDKAINQIDEAIKSDVSKNIIAGIDRQETNAKVIEKFYGNTKLNGVVVAKQDDLVDALAVGPLAAKKDIPVVLATNNLTKSQNDILGNKKSEKVYRVGGGIGDSVINKVKELVNNRK